MSRKDGRRLATAEERVLLNAVGRCWVVRDYGKNERKLPAWMFCPNPRRAGKATCEHHNNWEKEIEKGDEE